MQIRKAERKKAKLRLGISAPTGAGKTYSSLLIASGIGAKVGLIDTENGSGDLYAEDKKILDALPNGYDIININAPYDPSKYLEAIHAFEAGGYDVIIIDSLSHAWSGSGGLLDKQGKEADKTKNSYTAWRTITPQHNALVDAILQSSCHVIVTLRAKTEYVQEKNDQGKTIVRKIGLAPVMRDGIEYEFTIFGELDQAHNFQASKDRTNTLKDMFIVPDKKFGQQLNVWLQSGKEAEKVDPTPQKTPAKDLVESAKAFAGELELADTLEKLDVLTVRYIPVMDVLAKELPAWYSRLCELTEKKRASFDPAEAA